MSATGTSGAGSPGPLGQWQWNRARPPQSLQNRADRPPKSTLPMTVLVFMDKVPKGWRMVPTHVSSENEAERIQGKFQITLSAVTPPLNVTVCVERERGD